MKIPVDSIVMPTRFVTLCENWHGGMNCMLYAVLSTRNLTLGAYRPRGCVTDEQWYLTIWRDLSSDVYSAVCVAEKGQAYPEGHGDLDGLCDFEVWINEQIERLEESYGLANWYASDN